jgi:hypothetical protein
MLHIAPPVGALVDLCSAPTKAHFATVLNVICYISCTAHHDVTHVHHGPVEMWCEANFAVCFDTRLSITCGVVACVGEAVWENCKKPITAVLKMDAECRACEVAASFRKLMPEFAWLSRCLEVGGALHKHCLVTVRQAALCLCNDRRESKRIKPIHFSIHFGGDHIASGELACCIINPRRMYLIVKALLQPTEIGLVEPTEIGLVDLGMLCV